MLYLRKGKKGDLDIIFTTFLYLFWGNYKEDTRKIFSSKKIGMMSDTFNQVHGFSNFNCTLQYQDF